LAALLVCAIFLSSCAILGLADGEAEGSRKPDTEDPVSQEPTWKGDPVAGEESNPSIKEKFGAGSVAAAFHELSAFIQNGGLEADPPVIQLGDWIDLDALSVESYGRTGNFRGLFSVTNTDVNPTPLPFTDYVGKRLRLIVVGINSFQSGKGVDGQYAVTENDGVDHVVFQFQNVLVTRQMNKDNSNAGGYAQSEMRKYLVKVGNDTEGGKFLMGLTAAGVPEDVLWAPVRYVANGGNTTNAADEINDLLWLPTEWEMFGVQIFSSETYETTENQARLEYYDTSDRRIKYYGSTSSLYWEASSNSYNALSFCAVGNGSTSYNGATNGTSSCGGVAPAFCVQ
jgi:hypothetical protein